jgi:glycerol-3-phosphate acyltransferase PlsY
MTNLSTILLIIANYLIGSISFAVIITRYKRQVDIRETGYKTAGGSNVARTIGIKWGILVGVLDFLKGIGILVIAKEMHIPPIYLTLIGTAAVIGHCWPIWFHFSGGRGIGTLLGVILLLTPKEAIIPILIFLTTIIPSLLKRSKNIECKWISSPTLTLLALFVYIFLTLKSTQAWDEVLSILLFIIVIIRRLTARISDYISSQNPYRLFLSRLLFDNSYGL